MPSSADEMIAALNHFEADAEYDENQSRLYPIMEGFRDLPDRERVLPAMFELMERFPGAYLGTPGPLVHSIESLGVENYESLLVESVRRQPVELNVWMINRILNTDLQTEHRRQLLDLLRLVPQHPKVVQRVADEARGFLDHQAKRVP